MLKQYIIDEIKLYIIHLKIYIASLCNKLIMLLGGI